jgi:hypothetical protein
VKNASIVVSAIPVQFIREVWKRIRPTPRPRCWRGLRCQGPRDHHPASPHPDHRRRPLKDNPDARPRAIGTLSGPTIAAELARCLPAAMIAASDDPSSPSRVQRSSTPAGCGLHQPGRAGRGTRGRGQERHRHRRGQSTACRPATTPRAHCSRAGSQRSLAWGWRWALTRDLLWRRRRRRPRHHCFSPKAATVRAARRWAGALRSMSTCVPRPRRRGRGDRTQGVLELAKKYRVEMPITAGGACRAL